MDEKDRKILNILQNDGRATSKSISNKIGLSTPAVLERIKKLENKGVIAGYKAILDHKKIGKSGKAILAITLDRNGVNSLEDIKSSLGRCEFIESYFFTTGKYDFFIIVDFRSIDELEQILMKELNVIIPSIKNIETFVVLSGEENLGYDIDIDK